MLWGRVRATVPFVPVFRGGSMVKDMVAVSPGSHTAGLTTSPVMLETDQSDEKASLLETMSPVEFVYRVIRSNFEKSPKDTPLLAFCTSAVNASPESPDFATEEMLIRIPRRSS